MASNGICRRLVGYRAILQSPAFSPARLPKQVCYPYACGMLELGMQDAANDELAYLRHRTVPIPASITPVPGYPRKLVIFRTNASHYWQVRCFMKGHTYKQSLRTTNKGVAFRAARDFFHAKTAELYGQTLVERPVTGRLFKDLVTPMLSLERARMERGEFSADGLRILQNRLHNSILPFFGDMPITGISYVQMGDFVSSLSRAKLSSTTIQQHLVATRKVLNYAQSLGIIPSVPTAPTVKIISKPRGSFSLTEYRQLVRTAREQVGRSIAVRSTDRSKRGADKLERYAVVGADLHMLIGFMVNSFVRPSDIKNLQHKHVTVVRGAHTYLRLNLPESKKHDKPIVTLAPAVRVYESLVQMNMARGFSGPDDYLFLPEMADRKKAVEFAGYQFQHILDVAGIGGNVANGKTRTLYSLRHTCITFRLLYGKNIDLITLARNARTSVEMIEKFYSSNLSAEMNIDLLQGKRG